MLGTPPERVSIPVGGCRVSISLSSRPGTARNFLNDVSKHGLNESMKQDKWIERIRRPSAISLFVPVRHIVHVDVAGNAITTRASSKTRTTSRREVLRRREIMRGFHARVTARDTLRGFDSLLCIALVPEQQDFPVFFVLSLSSGKLVNSFVRRL